MSAQIFRRQQSSYQDQIDENNSQVGLAVGAWIGIVVAIIVIKVLVVVAICYCCKRRERQRREARMKSPLYSAPTYIPPGHGPAQYTTSSYYVPQTDGVTETKGPASEMPAQPADFHSFAHPSPQAAHHAAHNAAMQSHHAHHHNQNTATIPGMTGTTVGVAGGMPAGM